MLEDLSLHVPGASLPTFGMPNTYLPEQGRLGDLDLDRQLYLSYARANNYLEQIQMRKDVPPNQVAQVMNTLTAILKEVVKMQTDLLNAERIKKIEACLLYALKKATPEVQEDFMVEYERLLGD